MHNIGSSVDQVTDHLVSSLTDDDSKATLGNE